MTSSVEGPVEFDALRRAAISYAQEASGQIWTDYNLHDPGVTLLEQTCFALSQIAYSLRHDVRDLLTNTSGVFHFNNLALFHPRKVLSTAPVTRSDLANWIFADPQVTSADVSAADPKRPGLYEVTVVPESAKTSEEDMQALVAELFARVRPLCCALGQITVEKRRPLRLRGVVEIAADALPESAAAEIYHAVSQILRGAPHAAVEQAGATRSDVFKNPARMLNMATAHRGSRVNLDTHLEELRALPGIRDIGTLTLTAAPPPTDTAPEKYDFLDYILPARDRAPDLVVTINGMPVPVDPARLREEAVRISAERIAQEHHHLHAEDWDVMQPGRHREFGLSHVDSLLPMIYQSMPDAPGAKAMFKTYRSAIDTCLREIAADLDALPVTYAAKTDALTDDPARHRQRMAFLDYLIALQGAEMPAVRHTGLHLYHSVRARHRFEISWRMRYLMALPKLHEARGTGPTNAAPGGFLAHLGLLADLQVTPGSEFTAPVTALRLRLDRKAVPPDDIPRETRATFDLDAPMDMLVPRDDGAEPFALADLLEATPFLADNALSPSLFRRLASPDTFYTAPYGKSRWQVLAALGPNEDPVRLGLAKTRDDAALRINRLRATWRRLNRACEGATLVEDILLRVSDTYHPNRADLVLTGWTARTRQSSYRAYVAQLVETLAPAHLLIRLHWLDFDDMLLFEARHKAAKAGDEQALADLRTQLGLEPEP